MFLQLIARIDVVIASLPILLPVINFLVSANKPVGVSLPKLFTFGVLWVLNIFTGRMPVIAVKGPIHIRCFISAPTMVIAVAGVFTNPLPMSNLHLSAISNAGFTLSGFLLRSVFILRIINNGYKRLPIHK